MLESLSTIAELGIGLAGFSGMVVAFGRQSQQLSPLDRLRIIGLLCDSLGAALFATLPLVLADSGISESAIWRASGMAFAICLAGFAIYAGFAQRALSVEDRAALHRIMWMLVIGGFTGFSPILAWNSIGFDEEPSSGPYVAALYFLLVYSSAQFFRVLLVRPRNGPVA